MKLSINYGGIMRIIHLADLHIGKRINGFSMIQDQIFALNNILELAECEKIEILLICGDIYDVSNPSSEAVAVFDDFITKIENMNIKMLIISGNHDSAERLSFAKKIMEKSNIYISKRYEGFVEKVRFEDEYGPINFYLLPYIKPISVRRYFPNENIENYNDAIECIVNSLDICETERNIILIHQFIINAQRSDSEEIYVGGIEAVNQDIFSKFDYVAMGHIHKKQSFMDGKLHYCGSLLKYSSSEANNDKSITILDFLEKGNINKYFRNIDYLHDMKILKGKFDDIFENRKEIDQDYVHIVLTDDEEKFDGISILRTKYPNLISMRYENKRTEIAETKFNFEGIDNKDPLEIFEEFYEIRNNLKLSEKRKKILKDVIETVWEDYES